MPATRSSKQKAQRKGVFINKAKQKSLLNLNSRTKRSAGGYSDPEEGPAPKRQHIQAKNKTYYPASTNGGWTNKDLEQAMAEPFVMHAEEGGAPETQAQTLQVTRGGGGGGGGVGDSTGDWSCSTVWTDNTIITTATRNCVCVARDKDSYKMIGYKGIGGDATTPGCWLGISTPWNYIDFNQYDVFFAPRDFQRLVNTASKWRPKRVTIDIFNIQIMQKTMIDADVYQYNNDLTGTIQVFADGRGSFPKMMYPNQTTICPPFPTMIYKLPQYAYVTSPTSYMDENNAGNDSLTALRSMLGKWSQFFVLETSESAMLRTGNEWSTTFNFDCGWQDGCRYNRPINRLMNPLYDTYVTNALGTNAVIGAFDSWRQPWMPGPYIRQQKFNEDGYLYGHSRVPLAAYSMKKESETDNDVRRAWCCLAPGPPVYDLDQEDAYSYSYYARVQMSNYPKEYIGNEMEINDEDNLLQERALYEWTGINTNAGGAPRIPVRNATSAPNKQETIQAQFPLQPGMVWENRPTHLRGPIWQQIPNTEGFCPGMSNLGGIPMRKTPGHIFVKITPKPTDVAGTYVNEYATFAIKITMEWEYEKHESAQWNPEPLYNESDSLFAAGTFYPDDKGRYCVSHTITAKQKQKQN